MVNAENFVREYTYTASDDDSLNDARAKAANQMSKELLNEIGIYIRSETLQRGTDKDSAIVERLKTVTAGIGEFKVLNEKWDGRKYFVKAKITVDVKNAMEELEDAIEDTKKSRKLEILLEEEREKNEYLEKKVNKRTAYEPKKYKYETKKPKKDWSFGAIMSRLYGFEE